MMKIKLLTTVLIVLSAVGIVTAAEVINVDIKGYGSNQPYVGNGAYDVGPNTVWTVYYGGWGAPVGSARSEGLVTVNEPYRSSVYAAQVWLGDNGQNHGYQYGTGLMNDGFVATSPGPEPNIAIFGDGAYQGVYDIYVYGRDAGIFRLTHYGVTTSQSVAGDANAGQFELSHNYVIFSDVNVTSSNPDDLYLSYTNKLNALQFVKKKNPVAITDGTIIGAGKWDVAGDKNMNYSYRTDAQPLGPDTFGSPDANIGSIVGYVDVGEFMGYDITVDDANQGRYNIALDINTAGSYRAIPLRIYLDDKVLGDVCDMNLNPPVESMTNAVSANLYKGNHTVKWELPYQGPGGSTGFNVIYFKFTRTGNTAINDCNEVGLYGFNLPSDLTGDCVVNLNDLDRVVDTWLMCNNPDPNGCF